MRRILVIGAALGLMLALRAALPGGGGDAKITLAVIGFVLLAAFTIGDLFKTIGLPRITGYILGGVALGPQVGDIISAELTAELSVFNTLALGLIALTAGLELELAAIRRVLVTLLTTVAGKIVLLLALVGGGMWLSHQYGGLLPVASDNEAIVLALVVAVLCIGTSPSIALAIVSESGAKGRLSDLTLAIAVFKDVVVVVALAVVIAVGRGMVAEGSGSFAGVMAAMARELGLSLAVGALVGAAFVVYTKYVGRSLLLTAVAAILVVAEVAAHFHLELLLVFITAGFVIRNFSQQEHHLLPALLRVSLPVFVVFFTTAGAKVDLVATLSVLPVAGGVAFVRLIAYWLAGRIGSRLGREDRLVRANGWLAYLPQAGVTLGLVLLSASALPELAEPIQRVGMAVVTINLLIGPVTLGIALRRAGEVPGVAAMGETAGGELTEEARAPAESAKRAESKGLGRPAVIPELSDETLRGAHAQLAEALSAWRARFMTESLEPLAEDGRKTVVRLFAEHKQHSSVAAAVRATLRSEPPEPGAELADMLAAAHRELRVQAETLPDLALVPLEARHLSRQAGDGFIVRWQRRWKKLERALGRVVVRQVPVQVTARCALERPMAECFSGLVSTYYRVYGEMLGEVFQLVRDGRNPDVTRRRIDERAALFVEQAGRDLDRTIDIALARWQVALGDCGAPGSSPSTLQLADEERASNAVLKDASRAAGRGRTLSRARLASLHSDVVFAQLEAALTDVVTKSVRGPNAVVKEDLAPIVKALLQELPEVDADASPDLEELLSRVDALLDRHTLARLRGLQMRYLRATQTTELLSDLAADVGTIPKRMIVLDRFSEVPALDSDEDLPLRSLEPSARISEELFDEFTPAIIETLDGVNEAVASLDVRVQQAIAVASYGVGAACESDDSPSDPRAAADALDRARGQLQDLVDELEKITSHALVRSDAAQESTVIRIAIVLGLIELDAAQVEAASWWRSWPRVRRARARAQKRARDLWNLTREHARRTFDALLSRPSVRDWIIRSGHERIDEVGMRDFIASNHPLPSSRALPPLYAKLFAPEPIEDARLAVAFRDEVEQVARALDRGETQDLTPTLILGSRGSGRTSMLNMIAIRAPRSHILRLDPRYHERTDGLLSAVANVLECSVDHGAIGAALRRSPSVVMIDDLERFLPPTSEALDDLRSFLRLVRATSRHTHWIVCVQESWLSLVDASTGMSSTFGRRIELPPLDAALLEELIETRNRISGFNVVCLDGSRRLNRILRVFRIFRTESRRSYFRALHRECGGRLRLALLTHARSVQAANSERLDASRPHAASLPFLQNLGAIQLAALSLLHRYRELRPRELALGLGIDESDVDLVILPLTTATLVRRAAGGTTLLVPTTVADAVEESLLRLGLRGGGAR